VFDRGRAIIMSTESDRKLRRVQKPVAAQGASDGCAKPPDESPDKSVTAAQRRGLARKITAYLRRSGLDCKLIGEGGKSPRKLH
jgi:hypothetical protein